MTLLWLVLVLGQTDECRDRSPGLSKCVQFWAATVDKTVVTKWGCKAACYVPKKKNGDGGTDASVVYGYGATKEACESDLKTQASRGCKP